MKLSLGIFSALSIATLLSACGGSSSNGSTFKTVEYCGSDISMQFPLKYSASLSRNITVRGVSSCKTIEGIKINGIAATSSDSFANWQAQIALQPGVNSIKAEVKEGDKNHYVTLGSVESNELFNKPTDMALSSDGSTLYVADSSRRHIVKINQATGERTVLSSSAVPNQNFYFGNMKGFVLNEAEGVLYVGSRYVSGVDGNGKAWILSVDITTGERTVLVDPFATAYTPIINTVNSLVLDAANKKLYASEQGRVVRIELDSSGTVGKQTIISSSTVPNATNPISDVGNLSMVLDAANERLIVADDGNGQPPQLLSVDISAANLGTRTVISSASSSGENWDRPFSIVKPDADHVIVSDRRHTGDVNILKVRLSDGHREVLRNSSNDTDKIFVNDHQMILDSTGQKLMISSTSANGLFTVDLSNNSQKLFAYNLNPTIAGYSNLTDIERSAIDVKNQVLYFQSDDANIKAFNLKTLKHSDFSVVSGTGNDSSAIDSMSFDSKTNAVIITGEFENNAHVRSYAIGSEGNPGGVETIISDDATGTGDDLNQIWDWERLNDTTAIIADDTRSPTKYYELDMASGNRTLIDVDYTGMSDHFESEDIALSADKKTLYVVDDSSNAGLYALNLTTKTFSTITNATLPADGNDLRLNDPESLALSSDGLSVYVGDNSASYLIKVNLATGAREGIIGDNNRNTNSWAERTNGISVDANARVVYTTDNNTNAILIMDEITNEWVMIAE